MKKLLIIIPILFFICCQDGIEKVDVSQTLQKDIFVLEKDLANFKKSADANSDQKLLQNEFLTCRKSFKKIEWAIAYFNANAHRFINGPALDELETAENKFLPPNGFQVIEPLIFPSFDKNKQADLNREILVLQANIKQIKIHLQNVTLSDDLVFDALKSDIVRLITLGITGFDSPVAQLSVQEAVFSLEGLKKYIIFLDCDKLHKTEFDAFIKKCEEAKMYCQNNNNFNDFDRVTFIKNHLNPLYRDLKFIKKLCQITSVAKNNPLLESAETIFGASVFNVDAFIPSKEFAYSKEKVTLGEKLFYDTQLSVDNDRNCATCHKPELAFTDGMKKNVSIEGQNLYRNTPTLTYAGLQNAQFWDLRQIDLEKQSFDVIANKDEMHGSLDIIIPKLKKDKTYIDLNKKAFPEAKTIENWHVQNAIASYVRSLNKFNSKFDNYFSGKSNDFSNEEKLGFNIFAGKGKCASCHFIPLFNGTVPPNYAKSEQEVIGTPETLLGKKISVDFGVYNIYQMPQLKNAFKTPTLRNVAKTSPYMHNGVFTTLEQVVNFYNKGGDGFKYQVDNLTLPFDKLNLTEKEEKALVVFMKTLNDL